MNIADLRQEYSQKKLNIEEVLKNPIQQFRVWFEEALTAKVTEPNAMAVATVSSEGKPSARILLLKGIEDNGFTFYTNYKSKKAEDLSKNPYIAATFFWPQLERQVRIQGRVEKTSGEVSDVYFRSRPRGSQIGAWSSPQSSTILNRQFLEEKIAKLEQEFEGKEIPRPPHWGGYIILPEYIEFWQGRASRLHDRILFTFVGVSQQWNLERLAP